MTKTLNMRNVYVILITIARVCLTDTVTKRCRRCRTMNIPLERKKKTCEKRRAGSKQQQQIIMFNFPQIYL